MTKKFVIKIISNKFVRTVPVYREAKISNFPNVHSTVTDWCSNSEKTGSVPRTLAKDAVWVAL